MLNSAIIVTRKSPLAIKQADEVHAWLTDRLKNESFEILTLKTKIDERLNWSLEKRGGIGLFTTELENALICGRAKLAIHSAKDMPTTHREGLAVAGYLPRAPAHDVLVCREDCTTPNIIATSSPRRREQFRKLFPNAEWTTIRGNVNTRLQKIADNKCEASIFAAAGLMRLNINTYKNLKFRKFNLEEVVPAPGQGAIAIQCRASDLNQYDHLFCRETQIAVEMEKSFLKRLGSGCQIPLGAHYQPGIFRVFHPKIGCQIFKIYLDGLEEIESFLDEIMTELTL